MNRAVKPIFAVLAFLILILVTLSLYSRKGQVLDTWEFAQEGSGDISKEVILPELIAIDESGIYTFTTSFQTEEHGVDSLLLRRISGYSFKINLNGQEIYSVGDFDNPTANIWNYSFLVDIPEGLLRVDNTLTIKVYGLHDVGFIMSPTLGQRNEYNLRVTLQNFYSNSFGYMISGASLLLGILLMFLGHKEKKRFKKAYFQFGLAAVFFTIYSFEYTYRDYTGSIDEYLWVRKIIIMAFLLSIILLIEGLYIFMKKKYVSKWIVAIGHSLVIPILFAGDYIILAEMVKVYDGLVLIGIGYIAYIVLKNREHSLHYCMSFFVIVVAHAIGVFVLSIYTITYISVGMCTLLVGLTYIVVIDFTKLENRNTQLNQKLQKDHLTGAYNREYLEQLTMEKGDILLFFDLDYFKKYNDTFGHQKGDVLLMELVKYIQSIIRQVDAVIRYGGDEFILYLKGMPEVVARKKIELVRAYLIEEFELVDLSYGQSDYSDSIFETMRKADQLMYEMKQNKKRT